MTTLSDGPRAAGLIGHLDELVEELRKHTPPALHEFDEDAIHKARVTTRRLKAAVDLLDRVLDRDHSKPFARLGRKLRRRLGPLRDIDVMLGHLEDIDAGSDRTRGAAWLRDRLLQDRQRARNKSQRKADPLQIIHRLASWQRVRQDVVLAQQAVPSLLAESMHTQLDSFVDQANQLHARLSAEDAGDTVATRHDPHQLRIAGKALRYTMELAQADGHELPNGILKTFKQMQECLGTWHDFVVMAERAMEACLNEDLPLHDPATQCDVLALIEYAMKRAQEELEGFAEMWDEQGLALTESIRKTFALTRPAQPPVEVEGVRMVTPREMGLGPAEKSTPPASGDASKAPPPAA